MECMYILLIVIHFTAGCTLSGERSVKIVTGHKGGSALLPCSCTDPLYKQQTFIWMVHSTEVGWTDVVKDGQHKGRLQWFNEDHPSNLSLLISDLREEDDKMYRCETENKSRDFWLHVKACDLVKSGETVEVTGFSGESVVLPCSCTDPQTKPNTVRWTFKSDKSVTYDFEEIYPAQTGQHSDRVRLTNQNSGDFSLLISHLTEEDQGIYSCSVQRDVNHFRLLIKVRATPTEDAPTTAESERVMMCVAHQKNG
ncbi:junctional adhesion molecule-like isoform X2 [Hoplias malabaricus]|uniref:junctional adhesion molecule-like isoform X2 n=1 Tax=Hoplias malabaricus TaxID=27720 RepID=UPI003462F403